MQRILSALRGILSRARALLAPHWARFRALPKRTQWIITAIVVILFIALLMVLRSGGAPASSENLRAVTLRSVGELSGNSTGGTMFGSVRSRAEAAIMAEAGGTVTSVHTSVGARVPAGFVIAQLENASERAAVLQAEGAYEAAIASRNSLSSLGEETEARNAYQSAYTSLDVALENYIDQVFGSPGPYGPVLLIRGDGEDLSGERSELRTIMNEWRRELEVASSRDPEDLLTEATATAERISLFLADLSREANARNSGATTAQLSALATARVSVDTARAALASASASYRAGSIGAGAGADASVKQALGALRAAEANLEKTLIRAPIGGVVNFLPIRVGDYVASFSHVATVAENSALEIVGYVSEDAREALSVGMRLMVSLEHEAVITSIAPALDPATKQIEVRLAVDNSSGLVNGESVQVALPGMTIEETEGPVYLPLSSVKLRSDDRVVFSVNEEGRLSATVVETGEVRGDRIEILTALPADLRIVSDARGLAEGERVRIAN